MEPRVNGNQRGLELTRRHFLSHCGVGLGSMALGSLLAKEAGAQGVAHHAPRAKNVIFLFMAGGPSQLDLFDYKPRLADFDGQPAPESFLKGKRFAFIGPEAKLLASRRRFSQHGQSGAWISELLPHVSGVADELCIVRSMVTDQINHGPAKLFMNSGSPQYGRPSMGSWVSYGIGSPADNLPGFVVLQSGSRGPRIGAPLWGAGFLPTRHQGVPFRSGTEPILHLSTPPGFSAEAQEDFFNTVGALNQHRYEALRDEEIRTRIAAYEMASRMQTSAPELIDLSAESKATLDLYGPEAGSPSFATNCLLARRLVERGVRFVQLYHTDWDHHGNADLNLLEPLEQVTREVDQPIAGLIRDLKQRGLLEDTLVIWGGEFGRTPMTEYRVAVGRDHHVDAFTMFLAGGGTRAGYSHGHTDELGFAVTEGAVHVHDLHATILHLLGLDHLRLTYRFQGRDFRLTDVAGELVPELLA